MCPAPGQPVPEIGETLTLQIDWERRYKLMRMHTACHLLTVVCPFPITGAAVGEEDSRVDFDMPETASQGRGDGEADGTGRRQPSDLHGLITDEELAANPGLVKSKNVRPPSGTRPHPPGLHRRRMPSVDSQPCGGTHVTETRRSRRNPHRQDREEGPGKPALPHPLRSAACQLAKADNSKRPVYALLDQRT